MNWKEGDISGVTVRPAKKFSDARGWLSEVFRADETPADIMPVMGYTAVTHPGVTRGPHEHHEQTDIFAFFGPGDFRLKLWDNRRNSPTYGNVRTFSTGEKNPTIVTVPPGVVHGYTNISPHDAYVLNFPNRLFAGKGRKQPVDEVRYESARDTDFIMDVK